MTIPSTSSVSLSLSHKLGVLSSKPKWKQLEIPATRFSCITSGSCRPKLGLAILSLVLTLGVVLILVPLLVDSPKMSAAPPAAQSLKNEAAVKAIAKANQDFRAKLYPALAKSKGEKENLFFSSFSVSSVLGMTFAGAKGATAEQLQAGLALPADDKDILHAGFEGLFSALQSNENFTLDAANRLFVANNFKLLEDFLKVTAAHFKAEAENVDFAANSEAARESINAWVAGKTNDKITDLIPKGVLTALTRLVLVNAVYFKGNWEDKFDPKHTKAQDFHITPEEKVEVQMMRRSGQYAGSMSRDLGGTILQVPYKGDRLAMVIFLPDKAENFAAMEAKFAEFDFVNLNLTRKAKFDLALPKFKLESTHDLDQILINDLGIKDMFDEGKADFSGITDSPAGLYVSKVLQKAFIEVNEEGSEAAAATAGIMMARAMIRTPEVICDRPFMFAIRDSLTGMTLFSGRVMDPTKQ